MSFWDLWDNFPKIKENWEESNSNLHCFIEFLNYKTEIEQEYANGLKKLAKSPLFNQKKKSLSPSLPHLQTICDITNPSSMPFSLPKSCFHIGTVTFPCCER